MDSKENGTSVRLEHLYDLLCASTHSHKGRMAALRMPRLGAAGDMPTIEPAEVVFSRALFFAVLNAEIPLLVRVLDMWAVDPWKSTLASMFAEMGAMVHRYRRVIDAFHKGYLIHREHVGLSDGTQIVYSIRLDGSSVVPGRKRLLTRAQATELREFVQQRLLQDKP